MSRPWLKWYPRDWRADPRLRMCSLAARGLWIELIGYMHEAEPYGHLTINGQIPAIEDIAALVGRPLAEVRKAMAELREREVFSEQEAGPIYSRRMVRDHGRSEEGREAIERRWANSPPNRSPNRSGDRVPTAEPITQKPEGRIQKEKEDAPSGATTPKKYAFESGVIRLNQRDFDTWKASFSHLDVPAELIGLTKWASEQGTNWFFAVSGALAKRNRDVSAQIEAAKLPHPEFKWRSGIEGVT